MTRSLGNGTLEVELGTGSWSARWPDAPVHAGPFHASVTFDGLGFSTEAVPGTWNVSAGSAFGRPGAWARWTARDGGVWLRLHVPVDGPLLVAEGGIQPTAEAVPGSLALAVGSFGVGPDGADAAGPASELVQLDRAGAEPAWVALGRRAPATATGREALIVTAAPGAGAAFGVQALHGAEPVGTAITVVDGRTPEVRVTVLDPGTGRASGDGVRSEAVAFGAGADPFVLADALAALASRTSG